METGRTAELYVITPGERSWVERALDYLKGRGDAMAGEAIATGRGRTLRCSGEDSGCEAAATHYTRDARGKMSGHCLRHWRNDCDPGNQLGLDNRNDAGAAASDPEQAANAEA